MKVDKQNGATMKEEKMIQELEDRFNLSKIRATIIYHTLKNHFEKIENGKS
jgi:hypothetical protein